MLVKARSEYIKRKMKKNSQFYTVNYPKEYKKKILGYALPSVPEHETSLSPVYHHLPIC